MCIRDRDKFDRMTTTGKDKYIQEHNGAQYEYNKAKYESDLKSGTLNDIEKVKRQKELSKDKVGSNYDKNTRDLYGMAKADVFDYISSDTQGNALAKKLLAFDDALVKAGVIAKSKFRDKYGNVAFDTSAKGGGGSKAAVNIYGGNVSTASSVKLRQATAPKASAISFKLGKASAAKPKVSIKRSKV